MSLPTEFPYCARYDADQDYDWSRDCLFCRTDKLPTLRWNIRIEFNERTSRSITGIGYFCQKLCAERYFWPIYCTHRLAGDLATFTYDRTQTNKTRKHPSPR